MACADGIQECLETVRDLRANDAQENYMAGLEKKIKAVEKHAVAAELGIHEVCSELLPADKVSKVEELLARKSV